MIDDAPLSPVWQTDALPVGDGHVLHVEQSGHPQGLPVLCLHGGPASGLSPAHRRFFDPARYRIIQFDQRGCGRSTPRGATAHNTTADLLADVGCLRAHLGIERWLVFGGSWGATLGLAYAAAQPQACLGLMLRGVFLASRAEVAAFFDGFELADATADGRAPGAAGVFERMLGGDRPMQARLSAAWQAWESSKDGIALAAQGAEEDVADAAVAARIDKYRVQAHYLANDGFLPPGWWRRAAAALGDLPVAIVHGTDDRICPLENSRRLQYVCANSVLVAVAGGRHNPFAPDMLAAIRWLTDRYAAQGRFKD